jgi:hypothetical protein
MDSPKERACPPRGESLPKNLEFARNCPRAIQKSGPVSLAIAAGEGGSDALSVNIPGLYTPRNCAKVQPSILKR